MIRQGQDADKNSLMQLWKLCFPKESERFIKFYFDKVYENDETLVYIENCRPVASLQMIPYKIKAGNNLFLGGYIFGAMTHPDFRNKGHMAQLLNASFEEMIKKGYDYTFLIPQEKKLIGMYEKYGFKLCKPTNFPHENIVLKNPKQLANIQQAFYDVNGYWLEKETPISIEHKGMIKKLNPNATEITALYMGMMLD